MLYEVITRQEIWYPDGLKARTVRIFVRQIKGESGRFRSEANRIREHEKGSEPFFKKGLWPLIHSKRCRVCCNIWESGGCSSTVEPQPSKLMMWVRFPSPAPDLEDCICKRIDYCPHSSGAEHFLGKEEVTGSNPVMGSSSLVILSLRNNFV